MRTEKLPHKFVEFIPKELEDKVLYVSIPYATAVHLCASGCGQKVVTPFTPTDWSVTFDGETVSLYPSIGNWSFPCRSHYWIENDRAIWAPPMSQKEIEAGRRFDRLAKERQFQSPAPRPSEGATADQPKQGPFRRLWRRINVRTKSR